MQINSPFLKRFLKKKISVIAAIIFIAVILTALFGPMLCRFSPYEQNIGNRFAPISPQHPLGTDYAGRDTFTRVIYGSRISMTISFSGVSMGCVIGVFLGMLSGFYGSRFDAVLSRITEMIMAFPGLLLAILIMSILGPGIPSAIITISIIVIPPFFRVTRGSAITLRNAEFIQSCKIIGESDSRILLTHILPNCLSMVIVTYTINIGTAVLTIAALSFLGLGVMPPEPEWGAMLMSAKDAMTLYPMGIIAPGLAITLVTMSSTLLGDGLRDALDPKLK